MYDEADRADLIYIPRCDRYLLGEDNIVDH
jgi:hypothetical protein